MKHHINYADVQNVARQSVLSQLYCDMCAATRAVCVPATHYGIRPMLMCLARELYPNALLYSRYKITTRHMAVYLMNIVLSDTISGIAHRLACERITVSKMCRSVECARDCKELDAALNAVETALQAFLQLGSTLEGVGEEMGEGAGTCQRL